MSIYSSHIFCSACSLIPKYILSFSLVLIYALCVYYLVYLALHFDSFIHIVLLFLFGYQALADSWLSCSFSLTLAYALSLAQFLCERLCSKVIFIISYDLIIDYFVVDSYWNESLLVFFFCTSSQTAVTTTNKCYNSNNTTTAPASGQQQAGNSNNNNNNGNSIYTRFTSSIKYAAAAAVVFSFN